MTKLITFFSCLFSALVCHGGITVMYADREVSALVGDEDPSGQVKASKKPGSFHETAEAGIDLGSGGLSLVRTEQTSDVGPASVTAVGRYDASSVGDLLIFRNTIDVTLRVTTATEYHLSLQFDPGPNSGPGLAEDLLTLRLRNLTTATDFATKVYDDFPGSPDAFDFAASGELPPGDYRLSFDIHDEVASVEKSGSYRLEFHAGPPAAVPLPPSAWAGLAVLGGVAGIRWHRRRRARLA